MRICTFVSLGVLAACGPSTSKTTTTTTTSNTVAPATPAATGELAPGTAIVLVAGETYDGNMADPGNDCYAWDSSPALAAVRARMASEYAADRSWHPSPGMRGTFVGAATHCDDSKTIVVIDLDLGGGKRRLVPAAEGAVYVAGKGPMPYTANSGDELRVGIDVLVQDAGAVLRDVAGTDCVAWPSPAIREAAGPTGWSAAGFAPTGEFQGAVVGLAHECKEGVAVAILKVELTDDVAAYVVIPAWAVVVI